MRIAFFEIEGWEENIIRKELAGHDLHISKGKVTQLCLPETNDFEVVSVFVDSRIDGTVLECFPNAKLIATRSTGYDHVDVAECARRNIAVANVPAYGENTVAEYAFGLILNLTRKMYQSIDK